MNDYYSRIQSEMEQNGICESDIQMAIKKIKELQENVNSKTVYADKNRHSTETKCQ